MTIRIFRFGFVEHYLFIKCAGEQPRKACCIKKEIRFKAMFESHEHIAVGERKQSADNSKHLELAAENDAGAERTIWEIYLLKHIQSKVAFFVK